MTELRELRTGRGGSDSVGCEWKVCPEEHIEKPEYPSDGVLEGSNQTNLEKRDLLPWLTGIMGGSADDRRLFGSAPRWSYPRREDYLLDSTKEAIKKRIDENKFTAADLPAEIMVIVNDPSVPLRQKISLGPLASTDNVADIAFELGTRNCLPYEDQFDDWSEQRVYEPPRYPCEAHHLLSKQFFGDGKESSSFQDLSHNAKLIGYDINCYRNGIMLPRFAVDIVCHGLPQHEGNHDQTEYNMRIAEMLQVIQEKCVKYCEVDYFGTITSQEKLINSLNRASEKVRQRIVKWEEGYQLRPDNFERREAAYKRINTLMVFGALERGYPRVEESDYSNGECSCKMCKKGF